MTNQQWATVLRVVSVILAVLAVATLIPYAGASKPNIMGFKSLCSFTPVSTVILLFGANTLMGIRKKKFLS